MTALEIALFVVTLAWVGWEWWSDREAWPW